MQNVKSVAYFSAEFGLDSDLPTYAGGLGILAGDIIHTAADLDYPLVGVGILYKGKDFIQHITGLGKAEQKDSQFDHDASFLRVVTKGGQPLIFEIPIENGSVKVKAYQVRVGDRTYLYLLSTDVDGNPPEWISDMDAIYRGDTDSQVRQQILLGVGGVKLLKELEFEADIYHINEGRPEFIIWEITKNIMLEEGLDFEKAWVKAKEKIVYTNHTLVPAGNLKHPKISLEKWANIFAKDLKTDPSNLIKDGIEDDSFSITKFALSISYKRSAVSKIHEYHSKKQWPNYNWTAITNGVHKRWQDSDYRKTNLTDRDIWEQHLIKKKELLDTVVKRTGFGYDINKLVITWARRLADYKQPKIIFSDLERLKRILNKENSPGLLLFAGNSHSQDQDAKKLVEELIQIFSKELYGSAIFVPNYNISLSNHLTSGSDIWLNTPKGSLEACGTSGMKALANGVLNCTVIDGWANEVNWDGVGWYLNPQNVAVSFYETMENHILPTFFERNQEGIPTNWVKMMRKSIEIAKNYSSERMFNEYIQKLY